jgi:hypothetical protein
MDGKLGLKCWSGFSKVTLLTPTPLCQDGHSALQKHDPAWGGGSPTLRDPQDSFLAGV